MNIYARFPGVSGLAATNGAIACYAKSVPVTQRSQVGSRSETLNVAYACNNSTGFFVWLTMELRQQLWQHSVVFISLVIALSSLASNSWRNEKAEDHRNIRTAGIAVVDSRRVGVSRIFHPLRQMLVLSQCYFCRER